MSDDTQSPISYGFPVPTLDSRIKRVESTVQRRRRGQIGAIVDPGNTRFRTVAATSVDQDGNVIIPASKQTTSVTVGSSSSTSTGLTLTTTGTSGPSTWDGITLNVPNYAVIGSSANINADTHPSSPDAMDDEFEATSLDAKWSWFNQGSATATLENGALVLYAPVSAGDNLRCLEQPAPVGTWKVRTKLCETVSQFTDFSISGMHVRNTTSGKVMSLSISRSGGWFIEVLKWTNVTTFSTAPIHFDYGFSLGPAYLEIENDGVNIIFRISRSGIKPSTIFSEALATFIGSTDKIGLFDDSKGTPDTYGIYDWFRRIS